MPAHPSTIRATIMVEIKKLPKDVRVRLCDRDWQVRERAEREIAEAVLRALDSFDIAEKPMRISVAPSVQRDGG